VGTPVTEKPSAAAALAVMPVSGTFPELRKTIVRAGGGAAPAVIAGKTLPPTSADVVNSIPGVSIGPPPGIVAVRTWLGYGVSPSSSSPPQNQHVVSSCLTRLKTKSCVGSSVNVKLINPTCPA